MNKKKKWFRWLGYVAAVCTILTFILRYVLIQETSQDNKSQVNTAKISGSESVEVQQSNEGTYVRQQNEAIIDSSNQTQLRQENK